MKEKGDSHNFFVYLYISTYLHTPWCLPAGQSPRGTYQSSALCVGKIPTCTWCRNLCWSRTRNSLSCTLEEETEENHKGLRNPLIWSWLRAKEFGERGVLGGIIVSLPQKRPTMTCESSLRGAQVYFRKICFAWHHDFILIFQFLFNVSKSKGSKLNIRWGIKQHWPCQKGWTKNVDGNKHLTCFQL